MIELGRIFIQQEIYDKIVNKIYHNDDTNDDVVIPQLVHLIELQQTQPEGIIGLFSTQFMYDQIVFVRFNENTGDSVMIGNLYTPFLLGED